MSESPAGNKAHTPTILESAWSEAFLLRLADCMDGYKNSTIASATGVSSESVRRYRSGSTPPIEFVCAVAKLTGTSLVWILTGEGPSLESDQMRWYLSKCSLGDLSDELQYRINALQNRIHSAQSTS